MKEFNKIVIESLNYFLSIPRLH